MNYRSFGECAFLKQHVLAGVLLVSSIFLCSLMPGIASANDDDRGHCNTLMNLSGEGDRHPLTRDLAGKRLWYYYNAGGEEYIVEHHYIDDESVTWRAVGETAELFPDVFTDDYYAFEIAPDIYFLNWCEAVSPSRFDEDAHSGAYPVSVVLDLTRLIASVAFTEPDGNGGHNYVIDQATLEVKD